ncbi:hypothetical protein [Luteibacter sp. 329MFSha]|uniref:hypothetical protein n=1 Tax=Luteibacter sp. 329MFSha TaxID=1798239 RepID=UPI000B7F201B|nr:hypothetical protein [Luteibacter sp. 329MFSha]
MKIDPQTLTTFWDWKVGDLATWFGGLASAAAAAFAGFTARQAYRIARIPVEEQERQRTQLAGIIAPALAYELRRAKEELPEIAVAADAAADTMQPELFGKALHGRRLRRTTMITNFLDRLAVFGHVESAELLKVAAGILNVRESLDAWRAVIAQRELENVRSADDVVELRQFAATCRHISGKIDGALAILAIHGAKKDHAEV